MPVFKTEEEAIERHSQYCIDTDEEGKYNLKNKRLKGMNRLEFILKGVPEESYALEIGCNSGGLIKLLEDMNNCYCKGIDISKQMVQKAVGKGMNVIHGKAEELPFEDDEFEVVLMTEVLEHIFDTDKVLKEAKRVLKPGGLFIGSVPHNESFNSNRMPIEQHNWHHHLFDKTSLHDCLARHFENISYVDIEWKYDYSHIPQWIGWKGFKHA